MKIFSHCINLVWMVLWLQFSLLSISAHAASCPSYPNLLSELLSYSVTSSEDDVPRDTVAYVTRLDNFDAEKRPVVMLMPGWGGSGDVAAEECNPRASMFANNGYVSLYIGFHQTSLGMWHSDLAESAKASLDALCVQEYADCSAIVIAGGSYGGTQTHPVVRYLHINGVFDGSNGANGGRKVIGILGEGSGYTLWGEMDADATQYSIAMIENLGDSTFPVDICDESDNCGARNRADYHANAEGNQYVLSYCPAGGTHESSEYADWDGWVLSGVKTMMHNHRGVPKFTGYVEPSITVGNTCLTALEPAIIQPQADCLFNWAEGAYPTIFSPPTDTSITFEPWYYRHYSQTNTYVGRNSVDNHVYYLSPDSGVPIDVGELSTWLAIASCQ